MLKLPANACIPMEVTELGITNDVKLSQALKALITIVRTVLGICTERMVAYSNASCPIEVTGYFTPSYSTLSGIIKSPDNVFP